MPLFTDTEDFLVDKQEIIWKNIRKLMSSLTNEEEYIIEEYLSRNKQEKHFIKANTPEEKLNEINRIPTFERHEEHYINPTYLVVTDRYYERLFHMEINDERRRQICFNYMET